MIKLQQVKRTLQSNLPIFQLRRNVLKSFYSEKIWVLPTGSNPWPSRCRLDALTTELLGTRGERDHTARFMCGGLCWGLYFNATFHLLSFLVDLLNATISFRTLKKISHIIASHGIEKLKAIHQAFCSTIQVLATTICYSWLSLLSHHAIQDLLDFLLRDNGSIALLWSDSKSRPLCSVQTGSTPSLPWSNIRR